MWPKTCHHKMAIEFRLSHARRPKISIIVLLATKIYFWLPIITGATQVKTFFLVSILMDMINALRQIPTWCVMQNGHVTFILTTLIVNLSKNDFFVKNLVDMQTPFVLQLSKKDGSLYPPRRYVSFVCFVLHVVFYFSSKFVLRVYFFSSS